MNKKIAVFLGDLFWSSAPYDGVPLYNLLSKHFETDLIIFKEDIRLNKVFKNNENFFFDPSVFKGITNLKIINDWESLKDLSKDYDLILTSTHLAPKTRFPLRFSHGKRGGKLTKCPIAVWDIGGVDLLVTGTIFADYFFVKGPIWKEWMIKMGYDKERIFVTGSPHYDNYLDEFQPYAIEKTLNKQQFDKKYGLNHEDKILLMPSNPASHTKQFNQSMKSLETMVKLCEKNNIELLLKTYPHDYVFYEKEKRYSGIYKRQYTNIPQHQHITRAYPTIKVVESQDHFSAVKNVDKIYNMAGSSIAWETFFTDSVSYATNFKGQKYYKKLHYLPDYIELPDEEMNVHVDNCEQIIKSDYNINKDLCSDFILNKISILEILKSVKQILDGHQ